MLKIKPSNEIKFYCNDVQVSHEEFQKLLDMRQSKKRVLRIR